MVFSALGEPWAELRGDMGENMSMSSSLDGSSFVVFDGFDTRFVVVLSLGSGFRGALSPVDL